MDQNNITFCTLDMMPCPALLAKDGILVHANPAAECYAPPVGTSVESLLITGSQEYREFEDGSLDLMLLLNGNRMYATVTQLQEYQLILPEEEQTELQALALAAQSLRRPLSNAITTTDQLFAADNTPQAQLSTLNRSLYQLHRIVNNMSDAYLLNQTMSPRMETRDIGSVLDELFDKNTAAIRETGISLHYSGLSETVYGLIDTQLLIRAVENLLANAIKYTPKDGHIEARLTRKGSMLYLTVQDSGCGIAPNIRQALFSRHLRPPRLDDSKSGIGLGMVLVRCIASIHGGTVLMQPAKDSGTRFTMTVAIRKDPNATVHSSTLHVDYAGGRDHTLLELSETLPPSMYGPN